MQKRMITDRKDKNMLLVVDVGNTNITFGVYRDKELVTTFRLMSKTPRTSDEYGVLITDCLLYTSPSPRDH